MKALLKKEWITNIRSSLIWLAIILFVYLVLCGMLWIPYTDIIPLIYIFAVTPVIGWFRSFSDKWHSYEQFTFSARDVMHSKYIISAGYALVCSFLVLLITHDFNCMLSAFLVTMIIPAICIPSLMIRNSSSLTLGIALTFGVLMTLFFAVAVNAYSILHQIPPETVGAEIPPFDCITCLIIPAAILFLSIIISFFMTSES